jgi:hypothetical protein
VNVAPSSYSTTIYWQIYGGMNAWQDGFDSILFVTNKHHIPDIILQDESSSSSTMITILDLYVLQCPPYFRTMSSVATTTTNTNTTNDHVEIKFPYL